jgi:hypothetical protein
VIVTGREIGGPFERDAHLWIVIIFRANPRAEEHLEHDRPLLRDRPIERHEVLNRMGNDNS